MPKPSEIAFKCAARIRAEDIGKDRWPLTPDQSQDAVTRWVTETICSAIREASKTLVEAVLAYADHPGRDTEVAMIYEARKLKGE